MDINQLILLVKSKIEQKILIQSIFIKDNTYLHKKHLSHQEGKFHLKMIIKSNELKKHDKVQATRKIYNILDSEIKKYIHSLEILIN